LPPEREARAAVTARLGTSQSTRSGHRCQEGSISRAVGNINRAAGSSANHEELNHREPIAMPLRLVAAAALLGAAAAPAAVPALAPAPGNCTCLKSAADADLITALGWVCGPGGKIDCSSINTGGSHFFPNDAVDHANFAFTEFYHAHASDGYDTCFFGGNAAVSPPPIAHWLFVQGGALDYPYPQAKLGIGLWDTIPSGKSTTYVTDTFNGKFQALPGGFASTVFSLWMSATTAPTDVHIEIYYLLPCGSALPRYRREWYNKMTLAAAPK
jgi:hypothetical protein